MAPVMSLLQRQHGSVTHGACYISYIRLPKLPCNIAFIEVLRKVSYLRYSLQNKKLGKVQSLVPLKVMGIGSTLSDDLAQRQ